MSTAAGGFESGRHADDRHAGDRHAVETVRSCGLTFHMLDDGQGGATLAQLALPRGWKAGRARLERDEVVGGPYILAFSATGPYGEELIYRSEIRSPQTAASAELRRTTPIRDPRDFLAASCDRIAAQFGIRLSGAAEFAGERAGGGLGGIARKVHASGMRVYELNDGATAPLMLGVMLSVEDASVPEMARRREAGGSAAFSAAPWRAVDCYCLVTPHGRFEHVAATALAAATATLRIDPACARRLAVPRAGARIA